MTSFLEEVGVTHRQLKQWDDQGYLTRHGAALNPGKGNPMRNELDEDQVNHLKIMAELVSIGFTPRDATNIAWEIQDHPGIYIPLGINYVIRRDHTF